MSATPTLVIPAKAGSHCVREAGKVGPGMRRGGGGRKEGRKRRQNSTADILRR